MSMGDEGDGMLQPIQQLARTLEQARPERLVWHYSFLEKEHHGSTPLRTLYDGLGAAFAELRVTEAQLRTGDLAQVEANHARLTRRLGYEVQPSEDVVNLMGYRLLESGKAEAAIALFRRNVERHGDSANVHDSLGEALEAAGQLEAARESYEKALALGTRTGQLHPAFLQHLSRVLGKLASAPAAPAPPAASDSSP
jgi:hypothetical protein